MYFFTPYRKSTGEILFASGFSCEEENVELNYTIRLNTLGETEYGFITEQADPATQYVSVLNDTAVLSARPELSIEIEEGRTTLVADGADSITLTGLPDPCEIIIDDPDPVVDTTPQTITGGGFVFSADDPGVYTIEILRWPFLPFRVEFTAT